MPIALLLQKQSATLPTLLAAAKALVPWINVVRAELTVRNRAHGIFLVRWFGTALPRQGPYLSVRIANLAELDARLLAVASRPSPVAGASSITTPVAALAGMIGGALSSPVGQIAGIGLLVRFGGFGFTTLLFALASIAGLIFLVGFAQAPGKASALAFGGVAGGGAAGAVVALAVVGAEITAVFATAASVARTMNAATDLFNQLRGPRAAVRNPLVGKLLELGDRLAALGAQLLGAVAFVVVMVGPRLLSVAQAIVAIRRSVRTTIEFLDLAKATLLDRVRQLTTGDVAIGPFVARIGAVTREVVAVVVEVVDLGVDIATNTLTRASNELTVAVQGYLADVQRFLPELFTEHPTGKTIVTLTDLMADKTKGAPKKPGLFDILLPAVTLPDPAKILAQLADQVVPPLSWQAIEAAAARPAVADERRLRLERLERRARAAVAGMAMRQSIVESERAGLRDALVANRAELGILADDMRMLVGGFLTPSLWASIESQVSGSVDAFVGLVYGDLPAPEPRPLPVLRPAEPVPVRPVIGTLRLKVPGAAPAEVEQLRRTLIARLEAQSYAVAEATWGR